MWSAWLETAIIISFASPSDRARRIYYQWRWSQVNYHQHICCWFVFVLYHNCLSEACFPNLVNTFHKIGWFIRQKMFEHNNHIFSILQRFIAETKYCCVASSVWIFAIRWTSIKFISTLWRHLDLLPRQQDESSATAVIIVWWILLSDT